MLVCPEARGEQSIENLVIKKVMDLLRKEFFVKPLSKTGLTRLIDDINKEAKRQRSAVRITKARIFFGDNWEIKGKLSPKVKSFLDISSKKDITEVYKRTLKGTIALTCSYEITPRRSGSFIYSITRNRISISAKNRITCVPWISEVKVVREIQSKYEKLREKFH